MSLREKFLKQREFLSEGIHDLSREQYDSIIAVNNSSLDNLKKSPKHWVSSLGSENTPTRNMILGKAVHCAVLEPKVYHETYVQLPEGFERRKTADKEFYQSLVDEGKEPLSFEDFNQIDEIVHSIWANDLASRYLTDGKAEQTLLWEDNHTGVLCKGRADFITDSGIVVDIKTTDDASIESFERSLSYGSNHRQSAFYSDAIHKLLGIDHDGYVMIAVERESPYGIQVFKFDSVSVEQGRYEYKTLLERFSECLEADIWPGYSQEIKTISLPKYKIRSVL